MISYLGKIGLLIYGKVFKNWHFEIQLFAFTRSVKDGITFFNININLDRYKSEHSPAFQVELTIINMYNNFWLYQSNIDEYDSD